MIFATKLINENQKQDLADLVKSCIQADGLLPALYPHLLYQKKDTNNAVFYYQKQNLIAFLNVWFFWPDACEISLLVAPNARKQGIARQLLQTIMPLLRSKKTTRVFFSKPQSDANDWLKQKGFQYQHSEYQMKRCSPLPVLEAKPRLTIREARLADMKVLCQLDAACFPNEANNMLARFTYLLQNPNYRILLALYENKVIGKAHMHWQKQDPILADIAVFPEYQKRGFGHELIGHCINRALELGEATITLDVETTNHRALNLYIQHGFKTASAYDFWAIPVERLQTVLLG